MRARRIFPTPPNVDALRQEINTIPTVAYAFTLFTCMRNKVLIPIIDPLEKIFSTYSSLFTAKDWECNNVVNAFFFSKYVTPFEDSFRSSLNKLATCPRSSLVKALSHKRSEAPGPFGAVWTSPTSLLLAHTVSKRDLKKGERLNLAIYDGPVRERVRRDILRLVPRVDSIKPIGLMLVDMYEGKVITYNDVFDAVYDFAQEISKLRESLNKITTESLYKNCELAFEEVTR